MLLVELKGETLFRKKKKGIEKKRKKNYKILHTKKHISSPYERETFLNSPRLGDN